MPSYFSFKIDISGPGSPTLVLNSGWSTSSSTTVSAAIGSTDAPQIQTGSMDVVQMKLWGDVDPAADPLVQIAQADSAWQPYQPTYSLTLPEVTGVQHVMFVQLMDATGNLSTVATAKVLYNPLLPSVLVSTAPSASVLSLIDPTNFLTFGWTCDHDFTDYTVRLQTQPYLTYVGGYQINTVWGSENVLATAETFTKDTEIITTIYARDITVLVGGGSTGMKEIKVFCKSADGVWSI